MSIKSAEKVLKVLKALQGHSLKGISNKEIAQQLGEAESQVSRALQTLCEQGFAVKGDDGLYTIGTTLVRFAKAHVNEVERAKARIAEVEQRTSVIV